MEILLLFVIIFFCAVGMFITSAMKAACVEAEGIGQHMIAESERLQGEFDQLVQQAMVELQKPQQSDGVVERMRFHVELKGR